MGSGHAADRRRDVRIAVIGAGFGGLCVALELLAHGYRNLVVYDARDEVGGTWSANRYPGVACDAPSHIYSLSSGPWHEWSRRFAGGSEILGYMHDCATQGGLEPHLRLGTRVVAASRTGSEWVLELGDGQEVRFDFVLCATGQLSVPALPDIAGLPDFAGSVLHTAEWPDTTDLRDRRVAVIGTGASAIQLVLEIAGIARKVTAFKRSAPYVFSKPDGPYSPRLHRLYGRIPVLHKLVRGLIWLIFELFTFAFWKWPGMTRVLERRHAAQLADTVTDKGIRAALTPDYRAGCKRILISSTYHACFNRDDVDVETAPIDEIDATGVRTARGHHDVDVIVCATGFRTDTFASTLNVTGRDGVSLQDQWHEGANAFLGISVPRFPTSSWSTDPTPTSARARSST